MNIQNILLFVNSYTCGPENMIAIASLVRGLDMITEISMVSLAESYAVKIKSAAWNQSSARMRVLLRNQPQCTARMVFTITNRTCPINMSPHVML